MSQSFYDDIELLAKNVFKDIDHSGATGYVYGNDFEFKYIVNINSKRLMVIATISEGKDEEISFTMHIPMADFNCQKDIERALIKRFEDKVWYLGELLERYQQ